MEKSRRRINLSFYSVEYFVYSIMIAPTENEGNRVLVFILAVWYWCVFVNVCAWVKSRILSGYLLQRRNFKSGTVLQSDFIFYLTKQVVLKTENNIKEIPTKVPRYTVKKWNLFVVVVYKIISMIHGTEPSIFCCEGMDC